MSNSLTDKFIQSALGIKTNAFEELRQNFFIEAQMRGMEESSIAGIQVNTSGRQDGGALEQARKKKASDEQLFLMLLDDIRERYQELERRMAEAEAVLKAKYGDNFIEGMAETFLSEEELDGLNTDDERMRALSEKLLDENGEIKQEYSQSVEAKYVRDWNEAEKLKPIVQKYEGRNTLEANEQREIYETAKNLPNVDAENMRHLSNNMALKEAVEQVIDDNIENAEMTKSSSQITFT